MKYIYIALLSAFGSLAHAADYPILAQYKAAAEQLVTATQSARSDDRASLQAQTRDLVQLGAGIMRLYAEKNPNCAAQFNAFLAEIPQMEGMTLDAVKARYHDGVGLPAAPRHCYFGRSQVVHPVMNIIRLKGEWSEELREQVNGDYEEVIEHLERIQRNLDNPPN